MAPALRARGRGARPPLADDRRVHAGVRRRGDRNRPRCRRAVPDPAAARDRPQLRAASLADRGGRQGSARAARGPRRDRLRRLRPPTEGMAGARVGRRDPRARGRPGALRDHGRRRPAAGVLQDDARPRARAYEPPHRRGIGDQGPRRREGAAGPLLVPAVHGGDGRDLQRARHRHVPEPGRRPWPARARGGDVRQARRRIRIRAGSRSAPTRQEPDCSYRTRARSSSQLPSACSSTIPTFAVGSARPQPSTPVFASTRRAMHARSSASTTSCSASSAEREPLDVAIAV